MNKDEALDILRDLHKKSLFSVRTALEVFFPEFKESEDERIRKDLISLLNSSINGKKVFSINDTTRKQMIAWLEKQSKKPQRMVSAEAKEAFYGMKTPLDKAVEEEVNAWLEKQVSPDMVAEAYLRGCNDTEKKWIEKQGEQSNNEDVEKEKNDYVSGQFLYCKGSFNEFKEGESYWLEYVGNDNYIGRSDNILNQKFHITPRQLYTWLDPRHAYNCNETNAPTEQGEKDSSVKPPTFTFDDVLALQCCMETVKKVQEDKDLYEKLKDIHGRVYDAYQLEKQDEQKPIDKVEPKYKAGDWIVSKYGNLFQIKEIVAGGYKLLCPSGNEEINSIRNVDKSSYLWSIAKARPGNVLATSQSIFIFKGFYIANKPKAYCGIMNGSFINCPEGCWTNEQCYPATEEQRKLLFEKMAEAGYEWDDEKKELTHKKVTKKSEHEGVEQGKREMLENALDAYCKVCSNYGSPTPLNICRQECKNYSDFKKAMEK